MNWLRGHKRVLGGIAAFALLLGIAGFAFTKGYFMHFVFDDRTISREAFLQMADAATTDPSIRLSCTVDWTLGFVYIYELHCFSTDEALNAYMQQRGKS